jgi:hypothetical protein
MSENENELEKALAENGNYHAEKADGNAVEASSYFDAQLKRAARIMWFSGIVVIVLLQFAFVGLVLTFNTKAIAAFAVVLVVAILLILTFSIQYEIKSTKIILLRELKLLRLEQLGLPTDQTIVSARKAASTSNALWRVLSLRETAAWFLALLLISTGSNQVTFHLMSWGITMTDESQVRLSPDGSGASVHKISYRHQYLLPLTSITFHSGDPTYYISQWLDGQGRDLPVTVSTPTAGRMRHFTVQFAEPIMPGDQVNYTMTSGWAVMAAKQGDIWTYYGGQKWGGNGQKFFLETVLLPQGAEIVSVEPKPTQQFVRDGVPTVRFQTVVDRDHPLDYTIQYRLPKENGDPKAPK